MQPGEIEGTVHRRLLEDRVEELKVGAVLLLKQVNLVPALSLNLGCRPSFCRSENPFAPQVGVFSPSHRNHYLNVTSNNLLRIYSPDGVVLSSTPLPPLVLVRVTIPENRNTNRRNDKNPESGCASSPGAWLARRPPGARVPDAAAL